MKTSTRDLAFATNRHTAFWLAAGCACAALAFASPQAWGQSSIPKGMQVELNQIYRSQGNNTISGFLTGLMAKPNGGFLITESDGTIRIIQEGATSPSSTFLDISADVAPANSGGRGLLSFNFHPDHMDPTKPGYRKLYTYHIDPTDGPDDGTNADLNNGLGPHVQHDIITEWTVNADYTGVVSGSRREVVRLGHPGNPVHSGGSLIFDDQNYMYLSHGSTIIAHSQDLSNTLGTVIRIDPLDPTANVTSDPIGGNGNYRIPTSNPFVSTPGALDEVYAYGMRNPYRMSRDPVTGVILTGDVGQGAREEVSPVIAGGNNGWPIFEGDIGFSNSVTLNPAGPLVDPIATYNHSEGRSVTGGFIYRGTALPELVGKYVFGDLIRGNGSFFQVPGRLMYFDPFDENGALVTDASNVEVFDFQLGPENDRFELGPTTFGLDENGEILVGGNWGGRELIFRIEASTPGLVGDYNDDGIVNVADYTVWRDSLGSSDGLENRDPGVVGFVGMDDYLAWKANYNATPTGSLATPEPSGLILLMLSGMLIASGRSATRR
ncbi:MAG: PQQ-dependent sugar dehydrogenase [Planctomycetota bacterium]